MYSYSNAGFESYSNARYGTELFNIAAGSVEQAGSYFNIKVVHIPVVYESRKVDLRAMKRAISSRTCMVWILPVYLFIDWKLLSVLNCYQLSIYLHNS